LDNIGFRSFIESGRQDTGGRQAVSEFIPLILEKESKDILAEIGSSEISIIFDGAMRHTDAYVFVVRYTTFIDYVLKIQQKVLALHLVDESLDGNKLSSVATYEICTKAQIAPHRVLCMMRDGCAVNGSCIGILRQSWLNIDDIMSKPYVKQNITKSRNRIN